MSGVLLKKIDWTDSLGIAAPLFLMFVLIAARVSEGYLLFHVLIELFAVIVGIAIAIIAYYMYKFTRNDFLLFMGIGFFWTALLDLFHMLSYYGMNIFADVTTQNPSTTLWIFARLFQITTLLVAPFIRFDTISPRIVFALCGVLASGAYFGTFMGLFPLMYVVPEGLTITKIALEYTIIIVSMIAIMIYQNNRDQYHPFMYRMIRASLLFGMIAEGCFTLYVDVYGFMNFLGHIFKFLAYWMIFRGIVVTALKEPFSMMAKSSSTYDVIPVPVVVVDTDGIIRQINRATEDCSLKCSHDLVGNSNHDLLHPAGVSALECQVCQAIEKGEFTTFEVAYGDNGYKQYTVSPIKSEGVVSGTLQICIDMSEQRKAQRQLMESETFYQSIFSSVDEAIVILENNTIIDCNELGQKLFETPKEDLIGKNILDTMHDIECRENDLEFYLNTAYWGENTRVECTLRPNNQIDTFKIIEFKLSKFGDDENNKLIMIARDITKQVEEDKLYKLHTRQAQMGEMISLIAHQWRQPLAIINAIVSQMRLKAIIEGVDEKSEYIENLSKIEIQSVHLSQTISDYRDFFRPDKPKEHFSASSLVQNAFNLIDHSLKSHSIEIEKQTLHDAVLCTYRNELLQVLVALLKNSLDMFIETKVNQGKIIVSVDRDEDNCTITVFDNAGGITPEVMKKLFVPYFTTKQHNIGTGLGLYMSKIIIEEHCGGIVDVTSVQNETTFTIKLPYEKEVL
jgi:PAS domain S-box-containing protein